MTLLEVPEAQTWVRALSAPEEGGPRLAAGQATSARTATEVDEISRFHPGRRPFAPPPLPTGPVLDEVLYFWSPLRRAGPGFCFHLGAYHIVLQNRAVITELPWVSGVDTTPEFWIICRRDEPCRPHLAAPSRAFHEWNLAFLKLNRTESVSVVAIAEGEPTTFLAHVCICTKIEAVFDDRFGNPASAGHSNNTLVTLVAAILDPDCIPVRCNPDAQATWSRLVA
jgi:hypothetical protein